LKYPTLALISIPLSLTLTTASASDQEFLRIGFGVSDVFVETSTDVTGVSIFNEDQLQAGLFYVAGGTDRQNSRTYGQLGISAFEDANLIVAGLGHDWMFTSRPFQPYLGLSGGLAWLIYTEDYNENGVTIELEGQRARGPFLGGQAGLYYQFSDSVAFDFSLQALGTSLETEIDFGSFGNVNSEITFIGNTVASLNFMF